MVFRKDIGFLRAVAVAAVVLYHFNVPGFSGGFTGVDVFFVISGFLMTGLVVEQLYRQQFSLASFYAARARRIIPALLVLGVGLAIFGYLYLPLADYREYLRTLRSALLFSSNLTFADTAGYFAAPLKENWLLHTWSLSVEWQFYLLYPLLLRVVHLWLGRAAIKPGLLVLLIASLVASLVVTPRDPVSAFYLLPTRAWEMLVGGWVYLTPLTLGKAARGVLQVTGLLLIGIAVAGLDASDPWPGYLAIVPVTGAALVIAAGTGGRLVENRAAQYLGRISYSTYLWHWPVVVLLYSCGLLQLPGYVIGGMIAALALGALSYHWVESRTPRPAKESATLLGYAVVTGLMIGLSATLASLVKEYPQLRFASTAPVPPRYASELSTRQCTDNPYGAFECQLGQGAVSVIMLGDSHAAAVAAAVQLENPAASLSWSKGGCPTLGQFEARDKHEELQCKQFNEDKFNRLRHEYAGVPVVLLSRAALYTDADRSNDHYVISAGGVSQQASKGASYRDEYTRTVCDIAVHHPVYLVKPVPDMPFNVYKGLYLQRAIFGRANDITAPLGDYYRRNQAVLTAIDQAARTCHAQVIDPLPALCAAGRCAGSRNGVPLYADDNHLVDAGNLILAPVFAPLFQNKGLAQAQ
ncbi:acyltransferase family protein [Pseudomonas sp. HR96]|uniref:acyltransferase family protein n=1 Tax=Pseudomonas sp. HR96 TaxID=1027966 RepID=UPI002A760C87|nr:acyltransferase family protein [Pseudomonas sp. HR96]WPO98878.1 acyltransferase family protein [Pseudomonas sp. HR96]